MKSKDTKRFLSVSEKSECLAAAGYRCQGAACTNRDLTSQSYEFHHSAWHTAAIQAVGACGTGQFNGAKEIGEPA